MESANPRPQGHSAPVPLSAGALTAGEVVYGLRIEGTLRQDPLATVYKATAEEPGEGSGEVVLYVPVDADLSPETMSEGLGAVIGVEHKNVTPVMSVHHDEGFAAARMAAMEGRPLTRLLARKARSGKVFGLKGGYNLTAHICNALTAGGACGRLRPGTVIVSPRGRVRLEGLGLVGPWPPETARHALSEWDAPCLPDDLEALTAEARDLVALRAIIFALMVGEPPAGWDAPLPPEISEAQPELDAMLDRLRPDHPEAFASPRALKQAFSAIYQRSLNPQAPAAPAMPITVTPTALPAVRQTLEEGATEQMSQLPEMELPRASAEPVPAESLTSESLTSESLTSTDSANEESLEEPASSEAAAEEPISDAPSERALLAPAPATIPMKSPVVEASALSRAPIDDLPDDSGIIDDASIELPPGALGDWDEAPAEQSVDGQEAVAEVLSLSGAEQVGAAPPPLPAGPPTFDKIPETPIAPVHAPGGFVIPELGGGGAYDPDALRWIIQRDGMDFGPFSTRQVVEQLFKEELKTDQILFDVESEERVPMSEHPIFETILLEWAHEKARREKQREEARIEAKARRRNRLINTIVAITLLVLVGGGGGYAWYQSGLPEPVQGRLDELPMIFTAELPRVSLPEEAPVPRAVRVARAKARNRVKAEARDRAERAQMRREERLAASSALDLNAGDGAKFKPGTLQKKVNARMGALNECLLGEARRDPGRKQIKIKMTALPRGDVINIKIAQGTPQGTRCVRKVLQGIKVPPFSGVNQTVSLPFRIR